MDQIVSNSQFGTIISGHFNALKIVFKCNFGIFAEPGPSMFLQTCEAEMIDGSGGSQRTAETKLVGLKIGGFDHFLDPDHRLAPYHVTPSAWVFGMVAVGVIHYCTSMFFMQCVSSS